MSPFTSEEITYFNHQLTTDEIEKYIHIHKYILSLFVFIFISILFYLLIITYI